MGKTLGELYPESTLLDITDSVARKIIQQFNGNHPLIEPSAYNTRYYSMQVNGIPACLEHRKYSDGDDYFLSTKTKKDWDKVEQGLIDFLEE